MVEEVTSWGMRKTGAYALFWMCLLHKVCPALHHGKGQAQAAAEDGDGGEDNKEVS